MAVKAVNEFGLDAELAKKANAKYDKQLEAEVAQWLEKMTGISFAGRDFGDMLQDGVVLCQLVNAVIPNKITRINTKGNLFNYKKTFLHF